MSKINLPPLLNSDPRCSAFHQMHGLRMDYLHEQIPSVLVNLIDVVNASALPDLANQFNVIGDAGWTLAESDEARRDLIKNSIALHRHKGTPWAIKELIRRLRFGEVDLQEGLSAKKYDGQSSYAGRHVFGDESGWASYRVILKQPITRDQGERLRRLLPLVAPVRCHLAGLHYAEAAHRYNGNTQFNGNYTHGVV